MAKALLRNSCGILKACIGSSSCQKAKCSLQTSARRDALTETGVFFSDIWPKLGQQIIECVIRHSGVVLEAIRAFLFKFRENLGETSFFSPPTSTLPLLLQQCRSSCHNGVQKGLLKGYICCNRIHAYSLFDNSEETDNVPACLVSGHSPLMQDWPRA